MNAMTVAEALNKFLWEVLELSPQEFTYWCAYFKIREREEERERKKNARKGKRRGRR